MKRLNQQGILELIHKNTTISRARIAEKTGLSPATVSNIVKGLLNMKLVKETSKGESRGGRKPVLLQLNPSGAYFIGIEWGISLIKGVILNLKKKVVAEKELTISSYKPDAFITRTVEIIDFFSQQDIDRDRIYGLGIGLHGLVNPERGVSVFAPHFKWEDIPIKMYLKKNITLPVFLDNDVRMMALAEKWKGRDNFVFINTGPGIGAAIVFNGNLHTGRDWSAGEFGHMKIIENGPLCSCGNHGCLESLISVQRLVSQYSPANYSGLIQNLKPEWDNMIKNARNGEQKAREILENAACYLGTGIANIVNLLNPESIIIGGFFLDAEEFIFPVLKEQVKKKALRVPGNKVVIQSTGFGDKVGAIGAATFVLQELFKFNDGNDNR